MSVFFQVLANALVSASQYALIGASFALVFRTCRFIDLAHAAVFTLGAYFLFFYRVELSLPALLALPLTLISVAAVGLLLETGIHARLRRTGASSLVHLLASLGAYIVLQNLISLAFGDDTKVLSTQHVQEGFVIAGARITPLQISTAAVSMLTLLLLWLLLRFSPIGRNMRAIASNPDLAIVCGLPVQRVILVTVGVSSALGALAGILYASDVGMTPTMGLPMLIMGLVAVVIGGVERIGLIALGAVLLAVLQHIGGWLISSLWKDAIAFVVLFVFLIWRPYGLGSGKKPRGSTG